jgi:hypothetical protein
VSDFLYQILNFLSFDLSQGDCFTESMATMVEKLKSLEKKMDQLDANITKTPMSILEQYDLAIFNQKMMFDKLWAKVNRQEALLRRVVGFGQTLQDITYIQTETASDVKLLLGEIEFGNEDGVEPGTLGPVEITDHSISGPETLRHDDMEQVVQRPTAASIIPPSPDVMMTAATPVNSQDDIQQTTTLVTSTSDHQPPLIANPGLPHSIADSILTGELLPPTIGNPGLPPLTGDHLYRSVANGTPPFYFGECCGFYLWCHPSPRQHCSCCLSTPYKAGNCG